MKKIQLTVITLCLSLAFGLSLALAGELASLHEKLAAQTSTQQPPQKQSQDLPDGVMLLPGFSEMPNRSAHGVDEVGLERSRCLATCPAYTVVIKSDGTFRYTGEYGVERLGEHTGTVDVGQLNQLMSFVSESTFMTFADTYTASFLDAPTTYLMVKKGDETKVIENYANTGPATLWAISELIDDLLETATWHEDSGN
jgi:hypothetical protein